MSIGLTGKTLALSFSFIVGAYIISLLLAGRKIRSVDLVECLKDSRE
ncbi:MAG: hypothetical protein ACI4EG_11220 [Fusicatenibacter sp.]